MDITILTKRVRAHSLRNGKAESELICLTLSFEKANHLSACVVEIVAKSCAIVAGEKDQSEEEENCDKKSDVQENETKGMGVVFKGAVNTIISAQRVSQDQSPQASDTKSVGAIDEKLEDQRAKRKSRNVDRLVEQQVSRKQSETLPGKGTSLRNIPNISYKLSKVTGKNEIVEALHILMYRRKGVAHSRKRQVLDFNGFSFTDDSAKREIDSRVNTLNKMNLPLIHDLLDVLDIKRGQGKKQAKMDLLISFLKEPRQLSAINVEEKDAEKKEQARRKMNREQKTKSARRNQKHARDIKSRSTAGQIMEDERTENPTGTIPFNRIKDEIHNMLEAMTNDEFTTVTTKMIMTKLSTVFQCDMLPRKGEVKEIAKAYAQDRLS